MPTYCFSTKDGKETVERYYSVASVPKRVRLPDGRSAYRDIPAEHTGPRAKCGAWPMWSDAAGCLPRQVPQFKNYLASRGVKAEFDREGCIKFESRKHRKQCCEALGIYDRSGGYGDPQRR